MASAPRPAAAKPRAPHASRKGRKGNRPMRFLIQLAFLTGFFILGFLFAHEPFRKALFEPLRDAVPQATDAIEKFHRDRAARTDGAKVPKSPKENPATERAGPERASTPSKPLRKEMAKSAAPARKSAAAVKTAKHA